MRAKKSRSQVGRAKRVTRSPLRRFRTTEEVVGEWAKEPAFRRLMALRLEVRGRVATAQSKLDAAKAATLRSLADAIVAAEAELDRVNQLLSEQ